MSFDSTLCPIIHMRILWQRQCVNEYRLCMIFAGWIFHIYNVFTVNCKHSSLLTAKWSALSLVHIMWLMWCYVIAVRVEKLHNFYAAPDPAAVINLMRLWLCRLWLRLRLLLYSRAKFLKLTLVETILFIWFC
jgi:hypothetical protein